MGRIRQLYFFDKKKSMELISFLNNSINDKYINNLMFHPLIFLHHFLPIGLKYLPESYVLKEGKNFKGLITVTPLKSKNKKFEIQKLFFEENCIEEATELIQYVVSKYKAKGATSIIIKVDDYLPELITTLISKCNFTQLSYEKLWRVNKFLNTSYDVKKFRSFRNSDVKAISNIYNDSLLPHFRTLLSHTPSDFKENIFRGLEFYTEYKYTIVDSYSKNIEGVVTIQTSDNENYIVDVIQAGWSNLDINAIISFASDKIKKRRKKFGLFVKSKRYLNNGSSNENAFQNNNFDCVGNKIVLTNSNAKILKDDVKIKRFVGLNSICPSGVIST